MNGLLSLDRFQDIWRGRWGSQLRLLITAAVLGLSMALGIKGSESLLLRALMGLAGLLGLLVLLRWPNLGLLGILFSGFFIPFSGPGGLNATVIATAGLTALWVFDMFTRQRRIYLADRQTTTPILVFIVSAVTSFLVGQMNWYPLARHAPLTAQAGGLAIFLISAAAFLLVANTVRDVRWLQAFCWAFVIISTLYTFGRLVPPAGQFLRRYFQAGATTSSIFWIWMLIIPCSQALLNNKLHIFWRGFLGLLSAAVLFVAVFQASDWKSGYLPPLAGMGVIIALLLGRKAIWFAPLALALAWFASTQAISTDEYSYISRLDAWKIVLNLATISPLFGLGFANYYWYTPLNPIMGWHVSFNSHSQYVDLIAQTGLLGLFCFFWIFFAVGRLGMRLRHEVPEGFMRAYVYGVLAGLVATLVAAGLVDWVLPFAYNIGMSGFRASILSWMFFGGLVAVQEIVKKQKATESDSSKGIGRTA